MESSNKCTPGKIFLWTSIIVGNLEYLFYFIWAITTDFTSGTSSKACWIFIITQPLWHLFIYVLYMG